jgi:hypothetical protein
VFDATYFRTGLPAQVATAGDAPTVELYLLSGQAHRVRSVEEVTDAYVVLDVYQRRAEGIGTATPWLGSGRPEAGADETHRAVIAYDAIAQVIITRPAAGTSARIGFGAVSH